MGNNTLTSLKIALTQLPSFAVETDEDTEDCDPTGARASEHARDSITCVSILRSVGYLSLATLALVDRQDISIHNGNLMS